MAGKTGTTQQHKSAAFVGIVPQMAGAVITFDNSSSPRPLCDGAGAPFPCRDGNIFGGKTPAETWYGAGQRPPRKSTRDAHVPAMPAVAVDGKTVRGARTAQGSAPHLLAALIHGGVVLAQRQIADKSNEITAFIPLLQPLDLTGFVITGDAMHTQRANARFLREDKDAHFILPVLDNQPTLFARLDILAWAQCPVPSDLIPCQWI